ncbi:hypothetical protein L596_021034 [Steinernema carpocapsae]|uniref:Uncharacterized protein n=1 Tax=Steinernema carpocapsae TaxID=34508 RepID=A0A4U5MVA3_STECR|nr:hypothetical protein L596_021034 [Steinernema carpocapsae]
MEKQLPITKSFQKLIGIYVAGYGIGAFLIFFAGAVNKTSYTPETIIALVDCLRIMCSASPFFVMYRGSEIYKTELSVYLGYVMPRLLSKETPEEEKLNGGEARARSYSTIEAM